MTDTNVQTTIGSPIEWYKLEVLRDVVNVKEAWEAHSKNDSIGVQVDYGIIRARTQSLFSCLVPYLKRKLAPADFDFMVKNLFDLPTNDPKVLRQIFWDIQSQLDKDNITKMDTRRSYDGTRVEKENANFGD